MYSTLASKHQSSPPQEGVAALITQRNQEEAAHVVGIGSATLLRWQKVPESYR